MGGRGLSRVLQSRCGVPGRVAGKCRRQVAGSGCSGRVAGGWRWTHADAQREHGGWQQLLKAAQNLIPTITAMAARGAYRRLRLNFPNFLLCILLVAAGAAHAATSITSVRVWPAPEYTRVTIEASSPITHELLILKNPERLA